VAIGEKRGHGVGVLDRRGWGGGGQVGGVVGRGVGGGVVAGKDLAVSWGVAQKGARGIIGGQCWRVMGGEGSQKKNVSIQVREGKSFCSGKLSCE